MINQKGIENGIRLSTAIGGSTNVALHIPAIGYEADCEITMDLFEELCRSTPHIAKMNPAAAPNVPDFHQAGGVSAVKGTASHSAWRCANRYRQDGGRKRCQRGGTQSYHYQNNRGSLA